jgi:hypothetical protein
VNTTTAGLAAIGAFAWFLTEGASCAGATTRYRSGTFRTQLVSHYGAGANGQASAGIVPTGADVMASLVLVMAVLALAFLVVTFIRRRMVTTG